MDHRTASTKATSSSTTQSTDAIMDGMCNVSSGEESNFFFSSIISGECKPFDFSQALYEGAIAGAAAGVIVEAALYPIDTIKTRLQVAHRGGKINLRGLYAGLAGNLVGVLPASAIFVGVYEPTKQKLLENIPDKLSVFAHLTAGAIAGAASSIVRVPTEVVKQRMQTREFASAPNAVSSILAKEGFKGLYAGYGSLLLRDLPFDAIQFCIYEQLRIGYKLVVQRELNDPENAVIGAFSGAISGAISTPLDVIKTRLMVQGSVNQYNGILDCARTIVREEGAPALLKSLVCYDGLLSDRETDVPLWKIDIQQSLSFPKDIPQPWSCCLALHHQQPVASNSTKNLAYQIRMDQHCVKAAEQDMGLDCHCQSPHAGPLPCPAVTLRSSKRSCTPPHCQQPGQHASLPC